MSTMKSKYYSTCPLCKGKIKVGQLISTENELKKWAHTDCVSAISTGIHVMSKENASLKSLVDVSEPVVKKAFKPSKYQLAIFEFIVNGKGHGMVEAVAGSGKTTTIENVLEYVPLALMVEAFPSSLPSIPCPLDSSILLHDGIPEKVSQLLSRNKVAFLAFNKHIATELKKRSPSYVHVSTLHALGRSLLNSRFKGIELDEDKVNGKMEDFWPVSKFAKDENKQEYEVPKEVRYANRTKRYSMRRLVSMMKNTLANYNDLNEVQKIIDFYGIDIPEDIFKEVLEALPKVMSRCKSDTRTMDFDDMLWLPIVHSLPLEKFHFMFVDEGQDLNACQVEYVLRSVDNGGRIVIVGDRQQSLYGFRGADVNAIPRMVKTLKATVLPLSITYRCPTSHVTLAKNIVPQLEASEFAKEGLIENLKYADFLGKVKVGDMVLCRTNAPLVKPAFEVIRRGMKAIIKGKDIGGQLIEFVKRFEAKDLQSLEIMMSEYTASEYQRFLDRGKELQADMVMDKFDTVKVVAAECNSVEDLCFKLDSLFSDFEAGVVFSSVHRAKGLESENVFILRNDLMPHPKAKQDWEQIQESNAQYVAYTRSKESLYFVEKG